MVITRLIRMTVATGAIQAVPRVRGVFMNVSSSNVIVVESEIHDTNVVSEIYLIVEWY